jgi:glutamate-1-semialdehyde aminotransferase
MPAIIFSEMEQICDFRDMANTDGATYSNIIWKLFEKGVMPDTGVHEPWFISASHTDSDADFAIGAFEEALREIVG